MEKSVTQSEQVPATPAMERPRGGIKVLLLNTMSDVCSVGNCDGETYISPS